MSISLFCYSGYSPDKAAEFILEIAQSNKEVFPSHYSISGVMTPDDIQQEMAAANGLSACSVFLVGLRDKRAAHEIRHVAELVRERFGKEHIVILYDNEDVY